VVEAAPGERGTANVTIVATEAVWAPLADHGHAPTRREAKLTWFEVSTAAVAPDGATKV